MYVRSADDVGCVCVYCRLYADSMRTLYAKVLERNVVIDSHARYYKYPETTLKGGVWGFLC